MEGENKGPEGNKVDSQVPPTSQSTPHNGTLMGVLAYLGPLVLIPFIVNKTDSFVKFHTKQGLVVFSIEVIVGLFARIVWMLSPLMAIVNIATLVLSIIGIINVIHRKEKELPLVGSLAKHFTF
jgi:uncharacterized membrane protein